LAARGFTANPDAIECVQGFADAMSPEFVPAAIRPDPGAPFEVEKTLFKYHAACYSTHAMIEAIKDMRGQHGIGLDDVAEVMLCVHTRHAGNCSIPDPTTGLQVKFSLRQLAVMAFDGVDTGALESYSADNANNPRYVDARQRVSIDYNEGRDRMTARLVVKLRDGQTIAGNGDVGVPAENLDRQWQKLAEKFMSIAGPVLGGDAACEAVISAVERFEGADNVHGLMDMIR